MVPVAYLTYFYTPTLNIKMVFGEKLPKMGTFSDFVTISFVKETKSATMNIFRNFYFLFKSFVKVELSYALTINMFTIAENCTEK